MATGSASVWGGGLDHGQTLIDGRARRPRPARGRRQAEQVRRRGRAHSEATSTTGARAEDSSTIALPAAKAATNDWIARLVTARGRPRETWWMRAIASLVGEQPIRTTGEGGVVGDVAGAPRGVDGRLHRLHDGIASDVKRLGGDPADVGAAHPAVASDLGQQAPLHHPLEKGGGVLAAVVLDERAGHLPEVGDEAEDLHLLRRRLLVLLGDAERHHHPAPPAAQLSEPDRAPVVGQAEADLVQPLRHPGQVLSDCGEGKIQSRGEIGEGRLAGQEEPVAERGDQLTLEAGGGSRGISAAGGASKPRAARSRAKVLTEGTRWLCSTRLSRVRETPAMSASWTWLRPRSWRRWRMSTARLLNPIAASASTFSGEIAAGTSVDRAASGARAAADRGSAPDRCHEPSASADIARVRRRTSGVRGNGCSAMRGGGTPDDRHPARRGDLTPRNWSTWYEGSTTAVVARRDP